MSNPNYNFEESKNIEEPEGVPQMLPQKVSRNDERIKGKPDLYGTLWSYAIMIFIILVYDIILIYLQYAYVNTFKRGYDFNLMSIAATAITSYMWLVPLALWAALKWTINSEGHDEIENQNALSQKMMSLFFFYGYSLSIYIKVAIFWTIQDLWLQWLLVLIAAFVSGAVLIFCLLPALKKSKYSLNIAGSILGFHFLLAAGFTLYCFHRPSSVAVLPSIVTSTVSLP